MFRLSLDRARWPGMGLLVVFGSLSASAQPVGEGIPVRGELRGAVVDAGGDDVFLSSYAADEVVRMSLTTGETAATAPTGDGPTALALSDDGAIVASLNRLSGSVTLIDTATLSVRAEIACGVGAMGLAALPSGRFAVVNSFADEIVIVDASTAAVEVRLSTHDSVPSAVAATSSHLAVAARAPAQILFYEVGSLGSAGAAPIPDRPVGLVSLEGPDFAILTSSQVLRVSAATGRVEAELDLDGGLAIGASRDRIYVLSRGRVTVLDRALGLVEEWTAPEGAKGLAVAREGLLLIDPVASRLFVLGPEPAEFAEEPAVSERVAEGLPTEPKPAPSEAADTTPTPAAKEEDSGAGDSVEARPVRPEEPRPAPEAEPEEQRADAAVAKAPAASRSKPRRKKVQRVESAAAPTRRSRRKTWRKLDPLQRVERYSKNPHLEGVGGLRPYAPRFGPTMGDSFEERVNAGLDFGSDARSLAMLDWGQTLRNIKVENKLSGTGTRLTSDGGVRFDVDDAHVVTDHLEYDLDGEVLLEGRVALTRESASMTADRLHYFIPESVEPLSAVPLIPHKIELRIQHPLVPPGYKERGADFMLIEGLLEADGIDLDEPARAFRTDRLTYDFLNQRGELINATGRAGGLYFATRRLRILGPADARAEDVWVTTCDRPVPHYRFRMKSADLRSGDAVVARNARLQVGRVPTPFFLPRVRVSLARGGGRRLSTEVDIGHRANIGTFANVAQWFRVTRNIDLAPRLLPTSQEGFGFGLDGEYDFMDDPTSLFYRSRGQFHTLYTTTGRGYTEAYHRQELTTRTVLLLQSEQWYDQDFVKDFFNQDFENRTGPRSFANLTHTRPQFIATGTVAKSTHGFTDETEKLPELTLHFLERRLGAGFYGTFDVAAGEYRTSPGDIDSGRVVTVGRLSYDWNVAKGLNLTPFVEVDGTYYSDTLIDGDEELRGSGTAGVTLQSRFQRAFRGRAGFSGFKHIAVPSVTFSYRPEATLDPQDTPRFDDLDDRAGRTRIESTFDNIFLGRNAETGETWRVARVTLYQGHDIRNELVQSRHYEAEIEVRPRPWWGFEAIGEKYDRDVVPGVADQDLKRALAYVFFDNKIGPNTLNGRLGYAMTESGNNVLNREVLYGIGFKLSRNWSVSMDHRFDVERGTISRQNYEIRRRLHKWEMAVRVRERDTGLDIGFEFNLTDFPGARISF